VLVLLIGLAVPLRYLINDWRLYIIVYLVIFSIYIYISRRLKKRSRSQPRNNGQEQVQGVQKPLQLGSFFTPKEEHRFCPNCGKENNKGAVYCSNCGQLI
jgi:hypothetical protein